MPGSELGTQVPSICFSTAFWLCRDVDRRYTALKATISAKLHDTKTERYRRTRDLGRAKIYKYFDYI
jgi:hypothetical protein